VPREDATAGGTAGSVEHMRVVFAEPDVRRCDVGGLGPLSPRRSRRR
jgi:hypothetical protein